MAGRPTDYKEEYNDLAYRLCLLGLTDAELAAAFDVSESAINDWKIKYPEFLQSIREGKEKADANVAEKLYRRATGYDHPDIHFSAYEGEVTETEYIKHIPPDVNAARFWLNNRQGKRWREKQEVGVDEKTIEVIVRRIQSNATEES